MINSNQIKLATTWVPHTQAQALQSIPKTLAAQQANSLIPSRYMTY